jgi:cytosine/creatinine deaminase
MIFEAESYWLTNAHVPSCLLNLAHLPQPTREGLCLVNLKISQGNIEQVTATNSIEADLPCLDLQQQIVLPCLIDVHTHLDKGHIWERSPNLNATFDMALSQGNIDREKYWQPEDVYRRMEFGLKCSYAHGTQAIRTHIDSSGKQADISLEVFQSLQSAWQDKITLQAVSLVSLDYYQTPEGVALADKIAEIDGVLGGVGWQNPALETQLDRVFTLAQERNLDLDFHVDENGDPDSICLHKVAQAGIRHDFSNQITCGHCCSLAVQSADVVNKTIELVKQAKIAVVSLPMCNLYLQDRQLGKTPHWRGVTRVHELKQQGVPVAFASDNCRDPFFGFGDHDVLEVFEQAVKIAHLDAPYADWITSVTTTPAQIMNLTLGKIIPGNAADLIIFPARYFSELLARSQHNRIVIRKGKKIKPDLPDYRELDDLLARN